MIELDTAHLRCAYLPLADYRQAAAQWSGNMLGTVCFASAAHSPVSPSADSAFFQVPMPSLNSAGASRAACEIWGAEGDITYGQRAGVRYGYNDEILFGAIQLDESQFDAVSDDGRTALQQAAETAYRAIFSLADALHFPHILRFWNYIADITGTTHGLERYRQFNMGRQDGFLACKRQIEGGAVPAASAVGFESGPLTVCFLAGRGAAPVAIENPRQISAYHYPRDYGPRSPTFSRASVARLGDSDVLFLSGTASIVGHRTLHVGDVTAQVRETLANIAAIVDEANRVAPAAGFSLAGLCYKVYVRHAGDAGAIHQELRRALGPAARLMFLKADICRPDLLVEIEATAGHPLEFAVPG